MILFTINTQALYLLEYLELNAILGVSHFTFYNHTLGPRASCALQNYMDEGATVINSTIDGVTMSYTRPTVSLLPWDLRMRSQKEIRTEGLFAALNDCLYRSMYRYAQSTIFYLFVYLCSICISYLVRGLMHLPTLLLIQTNSNELYTFAYENRTLLTLSRQAGN